MTADLSLVLIAGLLDRIRGGWPAGRPSWVAHVATALAGGAMVAAVTLDWRLILAGALLVGELSWRQDAGWRGDWVRGQGRWWQPLRWGALWSAPLVCMGYFEHGLLWYAAAAPAGAGLAILMGCRLPPIGALDLRHGWPWSEVLELPIIGLLTMLATRVAA